MYVVFWWKNQKKIGHYKNLDVSARIISKWIFESRRMR
jgi:hypothetical protein